MGCLLFWLSVRVSLCQCVPPVLGENWGKISTSGPSPDGYGRRSAVRLRASTFPGCKQGAAETRAISQEDYDLDEEEPTDEDLVEVDDVA